MILVTGGTGIVGAHLLLQLLQNGNEVKALKRKDSNTQQTLKTFGYYTDNANELFQKIKWVDGDLNDIYSLLDALNGVEKVYHAAAVVSFNPKDEQQMMEANINGTANLVDAALEKKIKKLCHVSSIAALGKAEGVIDETNYWKASAENSLYAISKYGAEREVWRAAEEGLQIVIVNPSVIIGPGNWTASSANMFTTAYKGLKFYTEGITGFVDVRDVVKAMITLMESNIVNERFIVSSENQSFRYFFNNACKALQSPLPSIYANKLLSEITWRVLKLNASIFGGNPLITKETARAAHAKNYYNNKKIVERLHFNFIPVAESIAHTGALFLKDKTVIKI